MRKKLKQTATASDTIQDRNVIEYQSDGSDSGRMVVKQYRRKTLQGKMIIYTLLRKFGRDVPIEYLSPAQRRNFEHECLTLWRAKGFRVPEILPVPEHLRPTTPHIGLAVVPGERLDHFLADPSRSSDDKLALVANIYEEMRRRHCDAVFEQNHRLVHYDANLRNFIIIENQPVHIDFEMGHLGEAIEKSAAREVKKFTLQILNILKAEYADQVIQLLLRRYNIISIIRRMIDEELKRHFFSIHLSRDQKRKRRRPGLLTKIDLAAKLKEHSYGVADKNLSKRHSDELLQAIETSWDGKFYQSLDDSDPRGRDMGHRYAVMGVPENFFNASVLDIGCNIGRICMDAKKLGAARAIGIDHRKDVVDGMNGYFKQKGIDVTLFTFDINEGVESLQSIIGPAPFEYVFALSIWSHVDQQKLWKIINRFCTKVCFFEDHCPSRVNSLDKLKRMLEENLHFRKIDFMGFTTDRGVRAVYRLEK
jgi:SAM-dependent methyltransferase/tRNA A-37 threonylcarbamoyl transferase component Bud32